MTLKSTIIGLGPVGYWTFSDGSGSVVSEEIAAADGSITDVSNWSAEETAGRGPSLNTLGPGDYAELPLPASLPTNSQISFLWAAKVPTTPTTQVEVVDAWAYIDNDHAVTNSPAVGENFLLFEYQGSSITGTNEGELSFTFGQFYARHVTPYVSSPTVNWFDGGWHLIACVMDFANDAGRLWIDGVEQALSYIDYNGASGGLIADGADAFTADGTPLLIGPGHTTGEAFDSSHSHFAMFGRALTQADVDGVMAEWNRRLPPVRINGRQAYDILIGATHRVVRKYIGSTQVM